MKLNAGAKGAMEKLDPALSEAKKLEAYISFTNKYPRSMKIAMLLQPNSPGNDQIFGYKADQSPNSGAFGRVFRVVDMTSEDICAVKIMKDEVFSNPELLHAFRRGATASKILTERNISGMVKFKGSYEIPPCIFMEYINGPTLSELIDRLSYGSMEIYDIILRISEIVRSAHDLPEGVLHRDLKPQNIMIKDYYMNNCEFNAKDIVLLDFDISWYKGAVGNSVILGGGGTGYAAPEQYELKKLRHSTQLPAVDVFAIGMLLYKVSTRNDPYPGLADLQDLHQYIVDKIIANHGSKLKSFEDSIANIIIQCTRHNPAERLGLADVMYQLQCMKKCELDVHVDTSSFLFINEVCSCFRTGGWKIDTLSNNEVRLKNLSKSFYVSINEKGQCECVFSYLMQGHADRDRDKVVRWLNTKSDSFIKNVMTTANGKLTTKKEIARSAFNVTIFLNDKQWNLVEFDNIFSNLYSQISLVNE